MLETVCKMGLSHCMTRSIVPNHNRRSRHLFWYLKALEVPFPASQYTTPSMVANRIWWPGSLSAFSRPTQRWVPIPLQNVPSHVPQRLSLISWNIDAFSSQPVSRTKLILNHILEGPKTPDLIFLQEVTPDVRASLLDDPRVRAAFLATDAEDQTSFEAVPFATMTLLSNERFTSALDTQKEGDGNKGREKFMLRGASRFALPSRYRRDALYVDITCPTASNTVFRLINVHLDSREDALHNRTQQMKLLARFLREPMCSGGIIAGDFKAISREDDTLIRDSELVNAWIALHERVDPDEEIEVLRPGLIKVPRPGEDSLEIPWSNHCGWRCTITVKEVWNRSFFFEDEM